MAAKTDIPLFWQAYKRVSGPGDTGFSATDAADRVVHTLAIVPAGMPVAAFSTIGTETPQEAHTRGNGLYAQKRYEEALAAYDKALALDPQDSLTWQHKGLVLNTLTRYQEASEAYEQALALKDVTPSPTRPQNEPRMPRAKVGSLGLGIGGEWASAEEEQGIVLLLNEYKSNGQTRISGTGEHWICGKVDVTGYVNDSGILMTLTPVKRSSIVRVELKLTLLPSGQMKGLEIQYGYHNQNWITTFLDGTYHVHDTRSITFASR